jgi:hypothetical protein
MEGAYILVSSEMKQTFDSAPDHGPSFNSACLQQGQTLQKTK